MSRRPHLGRCGELLAPIVFANQGLRLERHEFAPLESLNDFDEPIDRYAQGDVAPGEPAVHSLVRHLIPAIGVNHRLHRHAEHVINFIEEDPDLGLRFRADSGKASVQP